MPKVTEQKRQETVDKILRSAIDLFSRRGYHNTQVMDVVRAANISAGTFYNYFKDKRELYERITRENFDGFRLSLLEIRRPVNIWDRDEQRDKLYKTFSALFDFVEEHPQLLTIMLRGGYGVDESFDIITWGSFSTFADDLAEDIQEWLDEGIIEQINPHLFGHAVVGMAMQIIHSFQFDRRFTRDEAIDYMIISSLATFDQFLTRKGRKIIEKQDPKRGGSMAGNSS